MIDFAGAWDTHVRVAPDKRPRRHAAGEYVALGGARRSDATIGRPARY